MAEPDWAKVLDAFYEQEGQLVVPTGISPIGTVSEEDEDLMFEGHNIFNQVNVPKTSVTGILDYLTEIGLVEIDRGETDALNEASSETDFQSIKLTEKGFNVAHEREIENQQEATNNLIAAFTAALVLIAAIEAIAVAPIFTPEGSSWMRIGGALMVLIFIAVVVSDPSWFGAVRKWGYTIIHSVASKL